MHFSVMCCQPVSTVALKELTHLKCCPIPDDKKENVIIYLKMIDKLNMRGGLQGINRFIHILFGRKT